MRREHARITARDKRNRRVAISNLEAAFANMYARYRRGDAPDGFAVDSTLRPAMAAEA